MNDLTIEQIAKYNLEHGTHFYKTEQVLADMKIKKDYESAKATDPADRNPREAYLASFDTAPSSEKVKYNWDNPSKRTVASGLGAAFALPAMAGEFATYGLLGGASRIAGGMLGSAVGETGGAWLGNKADEAIGNGKHTFRNLGGIAGGFAGWNPGSRLLYKGALNQAGRGLQLTTKFNTNRFNSDVVGNSLSQNIKHTKPIYNLSNRYVKWNPHGSTYSLFENNAEGSREIGNLKVSIEDGYIHPITIINSSERTGNIVKGVSEDLMNAAIKHQNLPFRSGEWLLSPEKTIKVWNKFPNKKLIGMYGQHLFGPKENPVIDIINTSKPTFVSNNTITFSEVSPRNTKISNYINPINNYRGNTSYKFYERPSTLTEAERLGLPKYERNNIPLDGNQNVDMTKVLIKRRDGQFKPAHIDYEYPAWSDRLEYGDIYSIDGKTYKRGSPGQFTKNNLTDSDQIRGLQRNGYSPWEYNYVLKQNRNGADPINMIEYAKTLPEPNIETTPFKGNDWFNYFDMFYENLGYNTSRMSPIDKLKIMEDSYNQLRAGSTGKLKGRIFWNGNPDRYTWSDSGPVLIRKGIPDKLTSTPTGVKSVRTSTSDNHGYYFGFQPFVQYSYPTMGRTYADQMIRLVPKARADMQPYMVNDINTIYERLPEGLHGKIPKNTVVNPSTSKGNSPIHYINGTSSEIGVGHGTSIKSIFPHPEAFIKGDDGIVTLTRDWKNPDVHLKQGGILKRK